MIYTDGLDINNKNSWSIIALKGCGDDENIIGDIRAYKNKNDDWVEISLIVKKGFRGIGIGSKLLEFMIKKLKKYGLKGIFCYIDEKNTIMINLINKFGFSRSPSDNNLYTKIIN
jgi:ribosomal protein S18 acetylase RimI-like enzyme